MQTWKVTLVLIGLTGQYTSEVEVRARNEKSALKKARAHVGNRDCVSMTAKVI